MSSRQLAYGLCLAAGIAILVLLVMPAVHVPFIVVHGPVTALRAQRSAWLLCLLVQAAAFLVAEVLLPPLPSGTLTLTVPKPSIVVQSSPNLALRC
jgi:hypothetical protein